MNDKSRSWFPYLLRYLGALLFTGGALLSHAGAVVPSMILFCVLAALETALIYHESGKLTDLRILLTLSWIGGIALSVLKLSRLSSPFTWIAWLSFGLFYFVFLASYDAVTMIAEARRKKKETAAGTPALSDAHESGKRLYIACFIVGGLSIAGLLLEAVVFRFEFPIFAVNTPHAYTSFHLTGVHYFVVSCVLLPAMTTYMLLSRRLEKRKTVLLLALNAAALAVPVLLLSKLHLVLFFMFPVILFLTLQKRWKTRQILIVLGVGIVVSAAAFALLTFARDYPEGYLEEIFQFKDPKTPVALQLPYVYVTNNYENFNLLTANLTEYSYGVRSIYPFAALTGLKFVPAVASRIGAPVYVTIKELNTLTILYDAYGDFGIAGVVLFGALLGAGSSLLSNRMKRRVTVMTALLYAEIALYLVLSFFTTWFSHPTTWFWFAAALAIGLFCKKKGEPIW